MDNKCVRVLRPYCEDDNDKMIIYIEDKARAELSCHWGDKVEVLGRRKAVAQIQPLKGFDKDGFIARAGKRLIDELYIEYGEEVLISSI